MKMSLLNRFLLNLAKLRRLSWDVLKIAIAAREIQRPTFQSHVFKRGFPNLQTYPLHPLKVVIDETGDRKKGKKTAASARQYLGFAE
ncbi:hypothetical protein [Nostoc sp.]|uniref:hypothetical protein n=1 Tax=Nostoc sp. TaxID=1180 RepID=UPI002FF56C22